MRRRARLALLTQGVALVGLGAGCGNGDKKARPPNVNVVPVPQDAAPAAETPDAEAIPEEPRPPNVNVVPSK